MKVGLQFPAMQLDSQYASRRFCYRPYCYRRSWFLSTSKCWYCSQGTALLLHASQVFLQILIHYN